MQMQGTTREAQVPVGLNLGVLNLVRVLVVSDDDPETERLMAVLQEAGLTSENATSITAGCKAAKSGRFQVVFCRPLLGDGSWRRLIELVNHFDLSFEVILLARTFDLGQWAEALQLGAFDVLDVLCDLPQAGAAAKRALGKGYLRSFRLKTQVSVG